MTEVTTYLCDMCNAPQSLNTSPQRMETNYVRFTGMIYHLDKDLSIQALCPKCAGIVGEFIKRNWVKTENRVPTNR